MSDLVEQMVVSVRADTTAFARDVADMRGQLEGPLATGAGRAGLTIERALGKAVLSGKFGFDDLKNVALTALGEIANASLRSAFGTSGWGGIVGGVGAILSGALGSALGLPGRATGGPVSAGRPYRVGERGPELFVPQGAGRIEAGGAGGARDVRVAISVVTPMPGDPGVLRQSSRQVARAVKAALR